MYVFGWIRALISNIIS